MARGSLLGFLLLALCSCGSSGSPPANNSAAGAGGGAGSAGGAQAGAAGSAGDTGAQAGAAGSALPSYLTPMPADPQRTGDPQKGYAALVNNNYVSCGIPWTAYSQAFGPAPEADRLPGRTGKSAELPYDRTSITTASGVEAVTANCLTCHAGRINGQLVVGLGNASGNFTQDPSGSISLAKLLLSDPKEIAELDKFAERTAAIGPYTQTLTVGVNPADNLAAVLFAHRDPATMAWSKEPLIPLPPKQVTPVDVPPWWHLKKKNAMYYVGAGRGDHARTMMAASTLCTDSVDESRAIDAYFPDIQAYLLTIQPPKYPFPVDAALAEQGRSVFEATCSRCHGTYGGDGAYPNLLVALDYVKTDPLLATGSSQFAGQFVDWFKKSFYGELSRLEPQPGYVAPPLDGIWASAPYLHNGSVPTVEALLDSKLRPAYWTRSFNDTDYDPKALGWQFTPLDHGHSGETSATKRSRIYDTTEPGYGNGGHFFGDPLTDAERASVIEYLKTL